MSARGRGASPGIATGIAVSALGAPSASISEPVIYVCDDVSAADLPIVQKAVGIVTIGGGLTCNAAIVARSLKIPCVVSCSDIQMDRDGVKLYGERLGADKKLEINGITGEVAVKGQP